MAMYDANTILRRIMDPDKDSIGPALAAQRLGLNERLLRDAMQGAVVKGVRTKDNDYLIDRVCVEGLGLHPAMVYGFEAWCNPVLSSMTDEDHAALDAYERGDNSICRKRRRAKKSVDA